MKHNHTNKRRPRSGKSPYARYGKAPCQHCKAITQESKARAQRGGSRRDTP